MENPAVTGRTVKDKQKERKQTDEQWQLAEQMLQEGLKQMKSCVEKNDFTELKNFARPTQSIKEVMAACMLILGEDPSWPNVIKVLKNPKLLERFQTVTPEEALVFADELTAFVEDDRWSIDNMTKQSKAAGNITKFIHKVHELAMIRREQIEITKRSAKLKMAQSTSSLLAKRKSEASAPMSASVSQMSIPSVSRGSAYDKSMSQIKGIKNLSSALNANRVYKGVESRKSPSRALSRSPSRQDYSKAAWGSNQANKDGVPNKGQDIERQFHLSEVENENAQLKAQLESLTIRRDIVDDMSNENILLKEQLKASERVRDDQEALIQSLLHENSSLKEANMSLYEMKEQLQTELMKASDYILQLESNCHDANQNALEVLKTLKNTEEEMEILKQYIMDLKARIAVYIPIKDDSLDFKLAEYINNCPDRSKLKIMFMRESSGVYEFGKKRVAVKVEKDNIKVRVGGGFLSIDEFIDQYTPEELKRLERRDPRKRFNETVAVQSQLVGKGRNEVSPIRGMRISQSRQSIVSASSGI